MKQHTFNYQDQSASAGFCSIFSVELFAGLAPVAKTTSRKMKWDVTIKLLIGALLVVLSLGMSIHAQAGTPEIQTEPVFLWGIYGGVDYGYSSPEEVIAVKNARDAKIFDTCMQKKPPLSCWKKIWGSPHPNPTRPNQVNDQYLWLEADGTSYEYYVDSLGRVTEFSRDLGSIAVVPNIYCPTDEGFGIRKTTVGPNSYREVCVKYKASPMQPTSCPAEGKSAGNGSPGGVGNPIQIVSGIKTEIAIDYVSADGLLVLKREFLGQFRGWRMPGEPRVLDLHSQEQAGYTSQTYGINTWDLDTNATVHRLVTVKFPFIRSSDNGEFHTLNPDGSQTPYPADANSNFPVGVNGERVEKSSASTLEGAVWRLTLANDSVEEYDTGGRLKKKQWRDGRFVLYLYQEGRMIQMRDNWGQHIDFAYDTEGHLTQATLPDGQYITYSYDKELLISVTYADGTRRQYIYNEPDYAAGTPAPYALTGLIDENGVRIGTYRYDTYKKAIVTESAGGVNKYSLQYNYSYTNVIDPLGSNFLYYFTTAGGKTVLSRQNQPAGSGCNGAASQLTYDVNGNIASKTDFNGNRTNYTYDLTRNLETSRTEGLTAAGASTPATRLITTDWHPTFRLPVKITEPGLETTYSYDDKGQVTLKSLKDLNTLQMRSWTTSYTYSPSGLLLKKVEDGPRTDVSDLTTYDYYPEDATCIGGHFGCRGQLKQVTDALDHITQIGRYNAHGQPEELTDPNGLVTTLAYDARQRLTSLTVGDETTSYSYDSAGLLTRVTGPDGAYLAYTYDDAHRLTGVQDQLGNTVTYTLDALGNRLQEDVRDPTGQLARSQSRVYDALSRLQNLVLPE